jgi:hypothetical protein
MDPSWGPFPPSKEVAMRDKRNDDPGTAGPESQAEAEEDLKATGDSINADVERLSSLEKHKRGLDPGDPQVDHLSDEAVELSGRIARETKAERQLSDEIG